MFDNIRNTITHYHYSGDEFGEPDLLLETIVGNGGFDEVMIDELGEDCVGKKAKVKVWVINEETRTNPF
jgi:hypothetical protein